MKVMNERDYKTFEQLVKTTQPGLKKVMSHWLREKYSHVVETKDYIYAVGDIPIALAAHMDTVFTKPVEDLFYDTRKNVMWSPQGLGADDRAGVFAIIQILRSGLRPHIILSTDEERGCLGAGALAKVSCPFENLRYIIQLDRRGANDCVFYDCDNGEFVKYVEQFGFIEAWGTFTDITEYCPSWGVAGVNLSVGYYNEHSASEVLYVNVLYATIEKVKNMLQQKVEDIPSFEYIPAPTSYPYGYGCAWGYDYKNWGSVAADAGANSKRGYDIIPCDKCGEQEFMEDMFPVKKLNGTTAFYCPDCLGPDSVEWCSVCYEPVEKDPAIPYQGKQYLCPDCKARKERQSNVLKK